MKMSLTLSRKDAIIPSDLTFVSTNRLRRQAIAGRQTISKDINLHMDEQHAVQVGKRSEYFDV